MIFVLQLATHKNAIGVAVGATIGHTICTSVAVIGGSMLASKISQRTVATTGGLLFLVIVFLSTSMILTFIQSNSSGIALLQSFLGFSISRLKRETNYLYYRSLTLIFFVCKCKHIEYVLHESEKFAVVLCLHCCKKEWKIAWYFPFLLRL